MLLCTRYIRIRTNQSPQATLPKYCSSSIPQILDWWWGTFGTFTVIICPVDIKTHGLIWLCPAGRKAVLVVWVFGHSSSPNLSPKRDQRKGTYTRPISSAILSMCHMRKCIHHAVYCQCVICASAYTMQYNSVALLTLLHKEELCASVHSNDSN